MALLATGNRRHPRPAHLSRQFQKSHGDCFFCKDYSPHETAAAAASLYASVPGKNFAAAPSSTQNPILAFWFHNTGALIGGSWKLLSPVRDWSKCVEQNHTNKRDNCRFLLNLISAITITVECYTAGAYLRPRFPFAASVGLSDLPLLSPLPPSSPSFSSCREEDLSFPISQPDLQDAH